MRYRGYRDKGIQVVQVYRIIQENTGDTGYAGDTGVSEDIGLQGIQAIWKNRDNLIKRITELHKELQGMQKKNQGKREKLIRETTSGIQRFF